MFVLCISDTWTSEQWSLNLGNIMGCIMQQNSRHLMHTFGTWVGWEQMRHGALWKGVNHVPDKLYRSEGGPSGLNPCSSPAFCLLSIIIDMAPSLSAICGLFTSGCPLCSWRSFHTKRQVGPFGAKGSCPLSSLGDYPPSPDLISRAQQPSSCCGPGTRWNDGGPTCLHDAAGLAFKSRVLLMG